MTNETIDCCVSCGEDADGAYMCKGCSAKMNRVTAYEIDDAVSCFPWATTNVVISEQRVGRKSRDQSQQNPNLPTVIDIKSIFDLVREKRVTDGLSDGNDSLVARAIPLDEFMDGLEKFTNGESK